MDLVPSNFTDWQRPLFSFDAAADFFTAGRIVWVCTGVVYLFVALALLGVSPHVLLWVRALPPTARRARRPALGCLLLLALLVASLLALLLHWVVQLAEKEPAGCWVYGLGVTLGGAVVVCIFLCWSSWYRRSWNASFQVILLGVGAIFVCLSLQLAIIFQRKDCAIDGRREFPHTALTALAMTMNVLPIISLVFLNTRANETQDDKPDDVCSSTSDSRPEVYIAQRAASQASFLSGRSLHGPAAPHRSKVAHNLPQKMFTAAEMDKMASSIGEMATLELEARIVPHLFSPLALKLFVAFGIRKSTRYPRLQNALLYGVSLSFLVAYSITIYLQAERQELGNASPVAGISTSLVIIMLDIEMFLYCRARLSNASPVAPLLFMLGCRASLVVIVAYAKYIVLVHALIFLFVGVFIGFTWSLLMADGGEANAGLPWRERTSSAAIGTGNRISGQQGERVTIDKSNVTLVTETSGVTCDAVISAMPVASVEVVSSLEKSIPERCFAALDRFSRLPAAPLVFLWSMFALDVCVVYYIHSTQPDLHPDIPSFFVEGSSHSQWSLLLQAGMLAWFVTLACCVGVKLVANEWQLLSVRNLAIVTQGFASGAGLLNFFALSDSYNILFGSIFLPVALLFASHACYIWIQSQWGRARALEKRLGYSTRLIVRLDVFLSSFAILACSLGIFASGNPRDALFMFGSFAALLTSIPVVIYYLQFFKLDRTCVCLLATCIFVIVMGTWISFVVNSEVNVRIVVAALLYPNFYVTIFAGLVWRAKFWRFALDVKVLFAISMLLTIAFFVVLITLVNSGLASASLWGAFAAGAATWTFLAAATLINNLWMRYIGDRGNYAVVLASGLLAAALIVAIVVGSLLGVGVLTLSLVCIAVPSTLLPIGLSSSKPFHVRCGFVMPIYVYNPEHPAAPFRFSNSSAQLVLAGLVIIVLWGTFAAFTLLMTIAICLSGFATTLVFLYVMHSLHFDVTSIRNLCADLTPEMVVQAVHKMQQLEREQLGSNRQTSTGSNPEDTLLEIDHLDTSCDRWLHKSFGRPALERLAFVGWQIDTAQEQAIDKVRVKRDKLLEAMVREDAPWTLRSIASNLRALIALELEHWEVVMRNAAVRSKLLLLLRMAALKATAEEEDERASLHDQSTLVGPVFLQVRAWPDMQKKVVFDMLHCWFPKPVASSPMRLSSVSWTDHQRRVALGLSPHDSQSSEVFWSDPDFSLEVAINEVANGAIQPQVDQPQVYRWERALDVLMTPDLNVDFLPLRALQPDMVATARESDVESSRMAPSFVLALRMTLTNKHGVRKVRSLFHSQDVSTDGRYDLRLYVDGAWTQVSVDDRMPCIVANDNLTPKLAPWHARSVHSCELWLPVLHKACAKASGSYHALSAMSVPQIVRMLTGSPCEAVDVSSPERCLQELPAQLRLWEEAGCLMLVEGPAHEQSNAASGQTGSRNLWYSIIGVNGVGVDAKVALQPAARQISDDEVVHWSPEPEREPKAITREESKPLLQSSSSGSRRGSRQLVNMMELKRQISTPSCRRDGYSAVDSVRESPRNQNDGATDRSMSFRPPSPLKAVSVGPEHFASSRESYRIRGNSVRAVPISKMSSLALYVIGRWATPQERARAAVALQRVASAFLQRRRSASSEDGVAVRPAVLLEKMRKKERQRQKTIEELVNKHISFGRGLQHLKAARRSLLEAARREDEMSAGSKGTRGTAGGFSGTWVKHVERIFAVVDPTSEACVLPETERFTEVLETSMNHGHHALLAQGARQLQLSYYSSLSPSKADHDSVEQFVLSAARSVVASKWRQDRPATLQAGALRLCFWLVDRTAAAAARTGLREEQQQIALEIERELVDLFFGSQKDGCELNGVAQNPLERGLSLQFLRSAVSVVGVCRSDEAPPGFESEVATNDAQSNSASHNAVCVTFELRPLSLESARADSAEPYVYSSRACAERAVFRRAQDLALALSLRSTTTEPITPERSPVRLSSVTSWVGSDAFSHEGARASKLFDRLHRSPRLQKIDWDAGLHRVTSDGSRVRMVPIGMDTDFHDLMLTTSDLRQLTRAMDWLAPEGSHRADLDRISAVESEAPFVDVKLAASALPPSPARGDSVEPRTIRRFAREVHPNGTVSVGDALKTHSTNSRIFTQFCCDYERCQKLLAALQKREAFSTAFDECEKFSKQPLSNWLATPFQHPIHKKNVLETILKHTAKEHTDQQKIQAALEAMEATLDSINDAVRAAGERLDMQKVKDALVGKCDDFVVPGRKLLRQGAMHQLGRSRAAGSTCTYMLIDMCEGTIPPMLNGDGASGGSSYRAVHHAILCNDSLWFAEVLRGEKYMISHVFRFNDAVQPVCSLLDAPGMCIQVWTVMSAFPAAGGHKRYMCKSCTILLISQVLSC